MRQLKLNEALLINWQTALYLKRYLFSLQSPSDIVCKWCMCTTVLFVKCTYWKGYVLSFSSKVFCQLLEQKQHFTLCLAVSAPHIPQHTAGKSPISKWFSHSSCKPHEQHVFSRDSARVLIRLPASLIITFITERNKLITLTCSGKIWSNEKTQGMLVIFWSDQLLLFVFSSFIKVCVCPWSC